ncbi:shikimate dehydrogenase [Aquabacter sp. CN5-332]|uniref:shikimate dehydrogenase family protein n=1 Tax=Aquabacter sp. CN5-332 TaxID=3156608 RepID=UPI0032B40974
MEIDGKTRVIPHLAHPSAHVKTPAMFNARCQDLGINAVVVPWDVPPSELPATLAAIRGVSTIPGVIVTIPHKETVALLCDRLEGVAADLGVANLVRKSETGELIGQLYDGYGFVTGLRQQGIDPKAMRVLLLGAGGAATAAAQALVEAGVAELVIANRNPARAERLAARLQSAYPRSIVRAGEADATGFDLIANATSVGLSGDPSIPLDPSTIAPGTIVAEMIMSPAMTPLLVAAAARGARIHLGAHMLAAQIDLFIDVLARPATGAEPAVFTPA